MAFYGCEFNFDGIPCSEYGLMIYDLGTNSQDDVSFSSAGEPQEDTIARRYSSFFYGITQNQGLEYNLVFGANLESIDRAEHIDRYEVEAIATWLTGHNTRKWLEIVQPDMETVRFKCVISELRLITSGNMPWAFSCKVTCDSPFAYRFPEKYTVSLDAISDGELFIFNRSTYNGYYKPVINVNFTGFTPQTELTITNTSDNNRTCVMDFGAKGCPAVSGNVGLVIDTQNQVVYGIGTHEGLNFYPAFNASSFLKLKTGDNFLKFKLAENSGNTQKRNNLKAVVMITCEYPVNVGG